MKKLNNAGFTHAVLAVLIVAVVAVIGFAGYTVAKHNKSHASGPVYLGYSVCGSGYSAWKASVTPSYQVASDNYGGRVEFFVNTAAHKMCAVNVAQDSLYGIRKFMNISIGVRQSGSNYGNPIVQGTSDSGYFRYYAGPVYVSLGSSNQYYNANYCVQFAAGMSYNGTWSDSSCLYL